MKDVLQENRLCSSKLHNSCAIAQVYGQKEMTLQWKGLWCAQQLTPGHTTPAILKHTSFHTHKKLQETNRWCTHIRMLYHYIFFSTGKQF
jgi:hypothetical protein